MSPLVIGARSAPASWSNANVLPASSPAPTVAAPATVPFFKNERRVLPFVNTFPSFFIGLPSFRFGELSPGAKNC
jgi:hypothetical protein